MLAGNQAARASQGMRVAYDCPGLALIPAGPARRDVMLYRLDTGPSRHRSTSCRAAAAPRPACDRGEIRRCPEEVIDSVRMCWSYAGLDLVFRVVMFVIDGSCRSSLLVVRRASPAGRGPAERAPAVAPAGG